MAIWRIVSVAQHAMISLNDGLLKSVHANCNSAISSLYYATWYISCSFAALRDFLFTLPRNRFSLIVHIGKSTPQEIHSPGPRLVLLFKAGPKPGSGFKANYRFETGRYRFDTGRFNYCFEAGGCKYCFQTGRCNYFLVTGIALRLVDACKYCFQTDGCNYCLETGRCNYCFEAGRM